MDSHSFGGVRWASALVLGMLHLCQQWGLAYLPESEPTVC